MTRVLLVRHAQSEWNREGRWQGWADPPLSPVGEEQARAAAARVRALRPARLVASDLRRAVRTAELLGDRRAIPALDPDLREYDAGAWTGLRRQEILERWPGEVAAWDGDPLVGSPGGEDPRRFIGRLVAALRRLHDPDGGPGAPPVLAVSHGRAIAVLARCLGASPGRIGHLEGWEIEVAAGGPAASDEPDPAVAPPTDDLVARGPLSLLDG